MYVYEDTTGTGLFFVCLFIIAPDIRVQIQQMSDDEISLSGDLFEEPEGFLPPPPPYHFHKFTSKLNREIDLRLVGKSPLWGHLLWNAGRYTAEFVEKHDAQLIKDKTVLEFGSASGLPCILAVLNGAKYVVATDYPDFDLLDNLRFNFKENKLDPTKITVEGFIWGADVSEIKQTLLDFNETDRFDTLIMSDLVFNHTEHAKLLKSCKELIKPLQKDSQGNLIPRSGGKCLVVFSPHRPHLLDNDLKFFEDAADPSTFGFDVEKIELIHWEVPMFPDDPKETEEIRKRIYSYYLHPTW